MAHYSGLFRIHFLRNSKFNSFYQNGTVWSSIFRLTCFSIFLANLEWIYSEDVVCLPAVVIIRPPGTISSGRAYVLPQMYLPFFVSPLVLRAPSTDRPETLPHGRNLAVFYNPTPKIRGRSPKKIWGQKHAKFRSFLDHFRLWSRISPEPLKISKISRRYKLWQFLLRSTKKVRWTLVH